MAQRKTKAKSAPKKAPRKTTGAKVISLKELLRDSDIDPKVARRKLRSAKLSGHDPKARWEFTTAQAKKAREALGI